METSLRGKPERHLLDQTQRDFIGEVVGFNRSGRIIGFTAMAPSSTTDNVGEGTNYEDCAKESVDLQAIAQRLPLVVVGVEAKHSAACFTGHRSAAFFTAEQVHIGPPSRGGMTKKASWNPG